MMLNDHSIVSSNFRQKFHSKTTQQHRSTSMLTLDQLGSSSLPGSPLISVTSKQQSEIMMMDQRTMMLPVVELSAQKSQTRNGKPKSQSKLKLSQGPSMVHSGSIGDISNNRMVDQRHPLPLHPGRTMFGDFGNFGNHNGTARHGDGSQLGPSQRLYASTMAIPTLLTSPPQLFASPPQKFKPSSVRDYGTPRNGPQISASSSNSNFILRKSKLNLCDVVDDADSDRVAPSSQPQEEECTIRTRRNFNAEPDSAGSDMSDEDEEEDEDQVQCQLVRTPNSMQSPAAAVSNHNLQQPDSPDLHQRSIRSCPYSPIAASKYHPHLLPSPSANSSSSWLGWLSPKFGSVSPSSAAKSASLSYHHLKHVEPDSGFDLSLPEQVSAAYRSPLSQPLTSLPASRPEDQSLSSQCPPSPYRNRSRSDYPTPSEHHTATSSITIIPSHQSTGALYSPTSLIGSTFFASSASASRLSQSQSLAHYSSSSGCSTQSSASSASFSRSSQKREAAQNFRDFVQHYERGLLECLSSVEQKQQKVAAQQQQQQQQQQSAVQSTIEPLLSGMRRLSSIPAALATTTTTTATAAAVADFDVLASTKPQPNLSSSLDVESQQHLLKQSGRHLKERHLVTTTNNNNNSSAVVSSSLPSSSSLDYRTSTNRYSSLGNNNKNPVTNNSSDNGGGSGGEHLSSSLNRRMSPISSTSNNSASVTATIANYHSDHSVIVGGKLAQNDRAGSNYVPSDNGAGATCLPATTTTATDLNDNQHAQPASASAGTLECQSLRLQLAKVRALRDQYETGFKCSEALEKIMKLTKSRDCDREWRANERLLADIEKQLEAMIGTIRICVEDLEGWARICPRDNYEIEFRHDKQRRTLRVHIGKALERIWDNGRQEVEFRGALKPSVACRVKEIKSRWHVMALGRRNVTLGVTSISMSELLVSVSKGRPILLDANASGSLKLRIRCSWQPTLISPEDCQNSLNSLSGGKVRSNTVGSNGPETGTYSSTNTSCSSAIPAMDDPNQSFRSALSCPQSNSRRSFDSSTFEQEQLPNQQHSLNSNLLAAKANRNSSSASIISSTAADNVRSKKLVNQNHRNSSSGADIIDSHHSPSGSSSASPSNNNHPNTPFSHPHGHNDGQFGLRKELARSLLALPSNFDFYSSPSLSNDSSSSPTTTASAQQKRRFPYSHHHNPPPPPQSSYIDPGSNQVVYSKSSSPPSSPSTSSSHSSTTASFELIPSPSAKSSAIPCQPSGCSSSSGVPCCPVRPSSSVQLKVQQIDELLTSLQSAMEDYRGQFVELTKMSTSVELLLQYFCYHFDFIASRHRPTSSVSNQTPDDDNFEKVEEMLAYDESQQQQWNNEQPETFSEIEDALAEFDFLDCEQDSSANEESIDNGHRNGRDAKVLTRKDLIPNNGRPKHQQQNQKMKLNGQHRRHSKHKPDVNDDDDDDDEDDQSEPIIIASYEVPEVNHPLNHPQRSVKTGDTKKKQLPEANGGSGGRQPQSAARRITEQNRLSSSAPVAVLASSTSSTSSSWLEPTTQNLKPARCVDPALAIRNVEQWSAVLILHLQSALQHLAHVGSWMLKGRETQALERLRADSFAFEQIHYIFQESSPVSDPNLPLGNDPRVLQLWGMLTVPNSSSLANPSSSRNSKDDKPVQTRSSSQRRHPFILSWRQLSTLLVELMYKFGLGHNLYSDEELEDNIRNSCEWLSSLIVPVSQTKVTLFDLRAFFELNLWQSTSRTTTTAINSSDATGSHSDSLSLRNMFQIALDVNQLMRKCKKLSFARLEEILFDRFSINASWIPADVTLTIVHYLYENYSHDRSTKLTTSEVKKWDRLREICKIGTNWLIWLLQDGHRYEIREHVLAGLESGSASTRRASCYGIMYIFKMLKRNQSERDSSDRRKSNNNSAIHSSPFYGQEMDSLLYVSMEDQDGRVREEARKALKCLGHYAQQRLSQMERSRMGFFGGVGVGAGMGHASRSAMANAIISGQSMPNLNRI